VTLGDEWKAVEYTLAANQLKSDWKAKQLTWNEEARTESKEEVTLLNKVSSFFEDLTAKK
jgi:hypothetical protein